MRPRSNWRNTERGLIRKTAPTSTASWSRSHILALHHLVAAARLLVGLKELGQLNHPQDGRQAPQYLNRGHPLPPLDPRVVGGVQLGPGGHVVLRPASRQTERAER